MDNSKEPVHFYTLQVMSVRKDEENPRYTYVQFRVFDSDNPSVQNNTKLDYTIDQAGSPFMALVIPDGHETLEHGVKLEYTLHGAIRLAVFQILITRHNLKETKKKVIEYLKAHGLFNEDIEDKEAMKLLKQACDARKDYFIYPKGTTISLKDKNLTIEGLMSQHRSATNGVDLSKVIDKDKFILHACGLMEALGFKWKVKEIE